MVIKDEDLEMRAPLKADMSSDGFLSSDDGDKQNKSSHRQTVLSIYDIDQDAAEGTKKITEISSEEEDGQREMITDS